MKLVFLQCCFIKQNMVGSNKLSQRGKRKNNHIPYCIQTFWLLCVSLIQGNKFLSATRHGRNRTKIPALSRWLSLGREQKAFGALFFFPEVAEFLLYNTIVLDPPFILFSSVGMGQEREWRSQGSQVDVEKSVLYLPILLTASVYNCFPPCFW